MWTSSLDPCTRESILSHCSTQFLYAEAKITLVELSRTHQYSGENVDGYVKHFYEQAQACCDPVAEDVLMDVCPHNMIENYWVYLENLSFSSFLWLMEVLRRVNESVKRTARFSAIIRLMSKKKPTITMVEKRKGAEKGSNSKNVTYGKKEIKSFMSFAVSLRCEKGNSSIGSKGWKTIVGLYGNTRGGGVGELCC